MHMMNLILMLILKVSTLLQKLKLNLVLAIKNVKSLRNTLISMRKDDTESVLDLKGNAGGRITPTNFQKF
jgi:hypothetical protein